MLIEELARFGNLSDVECCETESECGRVFGWKCFGSSLFRSLNFDETGFILISWPNRRNGE